MLKSGWTIRHTVWIPQMNSQLISDAFVYKLLQIEKKK